MATQTPPEAPPQSPARSVATIEDKRLRVTTVRYKDAERPPSVLASISGPMGGSLQRAHLTPERAREIGVAFIEAAADAEAGRIHLDLSYEW